MPQEGRTLIGAIVEACRRISDPEDFRDLPFLPFALFAFAIVLYWVPLDEQRISQVYYVFGGPVMAIVMVAGLVNILILKRSLQASLEAEERRRDEHDQRLGMERRRLAVDLCLRFEDHVIPLVDESIRSLGSKPFPRARPGEDPWDIESYDKTSWRGYRLRFTGGLQPKSEQITKVVAALNAIEAIAVPFYCGVADIETAGRSIGPGFTSATRSLAFLIARDALGVSYPATHSLYLQWERLESPENHKDNLISVISGEPTDLSVKRGRL